jgi:polyphosphate:AMP phosphotransferase
MFESADLTHTISKATYIREERRLREALLAAQTAARAAGRFAVLILIAGVEGAGKGETVNLLNAWMDPRFIEVTGFKLPSEEERSRPPMWRFWRALPPRGKIGVFFGAWHTAPILERVSGAIGAAAFAQHMAEITRFERMLVDEGVLLVKYWFHISKAQQKRRLEALERDRATRWRVTGDDWRLLKQYDRFVGVCEPFLRGTSTAEAPWVVVPGADPRYRALHVGRHLLAQLHGRLAQEDDAGGTARARRAPPPAAPAPARSPPLSARVDQVNVLRALQLDRHLAEPEYARKLIKWQGRLSDLTRDPRYRRIGVLAVFEGNDAAGKGGAVRRVTGALDARHYRVVPIAAPSDEERAHPYMWRFWRRIGPPGFLTIFDRSWYGRVLVERVENFCKPADWSRAYSEINDFEQQLVRHGTVVAKLWLAISKDEQYRRFKEREQIAFKRFKITAEDWRNRRKWDDYEAAVCDMIDRTSTGAAPWTLVEANDKHFARIKVLKTLCRAIERGFETAR